MINKQTQKNIYEPSSGWKSYKNPSNKPFKYKNWLFELYVKLLFQFDYDNGHRSYNNNKSNYRIFLDYSYKHEWRMWMWVNGFSFGINIVKPYRDIIRAFIVYFLMTLLMFHKNLLKKYIFD